MRSTWRPGPGWHIRRRLPCHGRRMRPTPHLNALRPRGARLALILFALAAIGGCECHNRPPTAPVVVPPLSAVIVAPGTYTLRVGDPAQFTAAARGTHSQRLG